MIYQLLLLRGDFIFLWTGKRKRKEVGGFHYRDKISPGTQKPQTLDKLLLKENLNLTD